MLTSKRVAAIVSLLLCIALYLSFLFAFSTTRDTYVCFIEEETGIFHCLSHGYGYTESNVYEAQKKYSPCSQQGCLNAIYNENYKITIEEKNYIAPILISLPISVAVYVLLTVDKKK